MKPRTGHLFIQGQNWYCRWKVDGKTFTRVLRDENNQPIRDKRKAKIAQAKLMAEYQLEDSIKLQRDMVNRLADDEQKLELIKAQREELENPPLALSEAWNSFVGSTNRPDSGEETMYQYHCQWNRFVDWLGEHHKEVVALRDVTSEIASEYAESLNHGTLSANTYNKHLNLLMLVFRVLKDKAKLGDNFWERIERKRIVTNSRRELTIDELKKVCTSATGELRTMIALGVYSGLRLGDCATLRWCEVDLRRGIITRIPNKIARTNPKPVIVPLHPTLRTMLEEIPAEQRGEHVLPDMAALYQDRSDLVTDKVQAHFIACGINPHKKGTGTGGKRAVIEVGFHSLRHSFVSMCRESDVPLAVVESLVGHSNPAMTRHYSHIGQLAATRAIAALPSMTGEAQKPTKSPETVIAEARALVESLSAKNWKARRSALLKLLAA